MELFKAQGKIKDPFDALDALAKQRGVDPNTLDPAEAMELLRAELSGDALINFANRAAGDDYAKILGGDPRKVALSIALTYAGPDLPSVYYRTLAGAGNNVE
jgi:hypothetical protein